MEQIDTGFKLSFGLNELGASQFVGSPIKHFEMKRRFIKITFEEFKSINQNFKENGIDVTVPDPVLFNDEFLFVPEEFILYWNNLFPGLSINY